MQLESRVTRTRSKCSSSKMYVIILIFNFKRSSPEREVLRNTPCSISAIPILFKNFTRISYNWDSHSPSIDGLWRGKSNTNDSNNFNEWLFRLNEPRKNACRSRINKNFNFNFSLVPLTKIRLWLISIGWNRIFESNANTRLRSNWLRSSFHKITQVRR